MHVASPFAGRLERLAVRRRRSAAARHDDAIDRAGQYRLGGVSQLAWLDAQRQQHEASLALTRARADRLTDTAALMQALAGGWWEGGPALAPSAVATQGVQPTAD